MEDQFDSAEFSAIVNQYYIPLRLVKQDWNYQSLFDTYQIKQIPSVVIIKPDGTEVDRIVDISNYKKEYTAFLMNAYEGKNTYAQLKNAFQSNPDNVEIAFLLFKKHVERGEIKGIVEQGKKILELEKWKMNRLSTDRHKTIFKNTRFHIKTSLFRFGKEAILSYFNEFPDIKFSKNIYRFLAFTYSKSDQSKKADQFFIKALNDYPDEYSYKKYFLKYSVNNKTQIKKATAIAADMINQKDFNDTVVVKLYEQLQELDKNVNY